MKNKKILLGVIVVTLLTAVRVASAGTLTIVSGANITAYGPIGHYAEFDSSDWGEPKLANVTWTHQLWPTIEGAEWISTAYYVENATEDSWRMFVDTIELPECAANIEGEIRVTADNAEEVYLNGVKIGSDGEINGTYTDNQEWKTILSYSLTGLQGGTNTLHFIVRNYPQTGGTPTSNPTGLIYKAVIEYTIPDEDGDGIPDCKDKCSETTKDDWKTDTGYTGTPGYLGVNRLMWDGSKWLTKNPKGKVVVDATISMEYTYGCSCKQILDEATKAFGTNMEGHYKFGCSKSVIESWHEDWEDGVLDGQKLIETLNIDSTSYQPTSSLATLISGKTYKLVASGTWTNTPYNVADAEYASNDGWASWFDGYNIDPWYLGEGEFDLMVDGNFVYWGPYNPSHEYTLLYTGKGAPVSFLIFDGDSTTTPPTLYPSWYGDNVGSLTVKIYLNLW